MSFEHEIILRSFRHSSFCWCLNICLQLVAIPAVVASLVFKNYSLCLVLITVWFILAPIIAAVHRLFQRRIKALLMEYARIHSEHEHSIDKLKKYISLNSLCFFPIFGFLTAFTASRSYCILDMFRPRTGNGFQDWLRNCDRCFQFWGVTHFISIIFGNIFWVLIIFHDNPTILSSLFVILSFIAAWSTVSCLVNVGFVSNNISLSRKMRGMDEETFKHMEVWRKSIKCNFIVYIPILGTSSLIPLFIAREILKDMKVQDPNHVKQYLKKCRAFLRILVLGSFISLPYIICVTSLDKWSAQNAWVAIPLLVNLITTTAINFCLAFEKEVYADMYLSDHKHQQKISEINVLSKVCASMIIFTLPAALPAIIVFMTKITSFKKKCGVSMG